MTGPYRTHIIVGLLALVLVLAGGYAAVHWQLRANEGVIREEMLRQAVGLSTSIHPFLVRQLHFDETDLENPAYLRIREQMQAYASLLPEVHIFSMKLVDTLFRFGPESLPYDHPAASLPGDGYPPSSGLRTAYAKGVPVVLGPFTDQYGSFVSALSPVYDTQSDQVLMMVGIDMPAAYFRALARENLSIPFLFAGFSVLLVLAWVFSLVIREVIQAGREKRFRHLETVLVAISLVFISVVVAYFASVRERKFQLEVFDDRTASIHREFVSEIFSVSQQIASIGRFIEGSELIEEEEFAGFVQPVLDHAPIETIGMGREVDAHEGPFYYPVKHVLPLAGNENLAGQDLMADQVTGTLAVLAFATGREQTAYLPFPFSDDSSKLYLRVFIPLSTRSSRSFLFADIYLPTVFRNAMFRQVFEEPLFHIRVHDLDSPDLSLEAGYRKDTPAPDGGFTWLSHLVSLKSASSHMPVFAFGKDLAMIVTPAPAFLKTIPATRFQVVLAIGLFLSLAFTLLIWFGSNNKAFLEGLVSDRTSRLNDRIRELSCMQQVGRDLQTVESTGLLTERILMRLKQAFAAPEKVYPVMVLDGKRHNLGTKPITPDQVLASDLVVSGSNRGQLSLALTDWTGSTKEAAELVRQVAQAFSLWLESRESLAGLKDSLAWQRAIFEGSRDAIFISDTHARFVAVNQAACNLTGYSRDELLAMHIQDLHEEIDLEAFRKYHRRIMEGEQIVSEAKILRKDGRKVDTSFNNQRIMIGEKAYMHSSARDMTDNKLAEMELIRAKEKAEESDRLKTAFLNNLSHEVRTPLNAIIGFSDILDLGESDPGKTSHVTGIIRSSSRQLLSIIDDIIHISTLEAGLQKAYETRTDINQLIRDVFDQHQMAAARKSLQLNIERLLPDQDKFVFADRTKVQQILDNLVGNALKFTLKGKVSIGCVMQEGFLRFRVSDTGIGIDPEHRDIIFERFRQVETEHARVKGGLGLGLSISKAFAEILGGRIWYESEYGKGSSFFFTLPYKPAPPEELKETPETGFSLAQPKTILVAEDEENNFALIRELLEGTGARLLHARDGREAVGFFRREEHVDLVLMDVKMPVMGGFEAVRAIRELNASVPVIAVTAYAQSGDRKKALDAGCDEYLPKPLTRKKFLETVRKFLEKS